MDSDQHNVRLTADLKGRIDAWRREQADLPTRPEAIRQLVEAGLSYFRLPLRKRIESKRKQVGRE